MCSKLWIGWSPAPWQQHYREEHFESKHINMGTDTWWQIQSRHAIVHKPVFTADSLEDSVNLADQLMLFNLNNDANNQTRDPRDRRVCVFVCMCLCVCVCVSFSENALPLTSPDFVSPGERERERSRERWCHAVACHKLFFSPTVSPTHYINANHVEWVSEPIEWAECLSPIWRCKISSKAANIWTKKLKKHKWMS